MRKVDVKKKNDEDESRRNCCSCPLNKVKVFDLSFDTSFLLPFYLSFSPTP